MASLYRSRAPIGATQVVALVAGSLGLAMVIAATLSWLVRFELAAYAKLAVGPIIGLAMWPLIGRARIGRPMIALAAAALTVGGAFLGNYALDFGAERAEAATELVELRDYRVDYAGMDRSEADGLLAKEWSGVRFSRHLRRRFGIGSGHDLWGSQQRVGTRIDGLFEVFALLIAFSVAIGWALARARRPVCRECGRWLTSSALAHFRHGVSEELVAALLEGESIAGLLVPPDTRENVELVRWDCPAAHNRATPVVHVNDVQFKRSRVLMRRRRASLRMTADEIAAIDAAAVP